ncbi:MAG: baseplate J/gp47 family protein [bacterium]|nr:baseplate J/gp47 family protein [bacterium]
MKRKVVEDLIFKKAPVYQMDEVNDNRVVSNGNRGSGRKFYVYALIVIAGSVLVLGLFVLLSSTFSRVSVMVLTTNREIILDDLVPLNKDGAGGGIKYEMMSLKEMESGYVPTSGNKLVSKYATGIVTIYNSFSPASQILVAGTRLETTDGKIYKIDKTVSIPGMSSVAVSVKAGEAGVKYNIPPTNFTIPGLKDSPKFSKIYAKSVKDISGGWSGELKVASSADITKTRLNLQDSLKKKLIKKALAETPKGFLLWEDGMLISFSDNTIDNSSLIGADGDKMNLQVNGVLRAIMILEDDLKNFIVAKKKAELVGGTKFVIDNPGKLSFKILNKDKINTDGTSSVLARITGKQYIMWDFDESSLKNKLSGVKRSKYQDVFKEFPAIEEAAAVFYPSWAFYFPIDTNRIEIALAPKEGVDLK